MTDFPMKKLLLPKNLCFSQIRRMGKFTLTNLKTDRVRVYQADDVDKEIINMRFKLDLGTFQDAELQNEYSQTGLEVFRFDIVEK